jgi:hypothetical protein
VITFFQRGGPEKVISEDEMRAAQHGVLYGVGERKRVLHSLRICAA